MGDDGYTVLFDVRDHWPPVWLGLPGFLFMWLAWRLWRSRATATHTFWAPPAARRVRVFQSVFTLALSLLWTAAFFVGVTGDHVRAQRILDAGNAPVVEGVITNFSSVNDRVRFSLGGVDFHYSAGNITPGYRDIDGPLANGSAVRITYDQRLNPFILKLERYEARCSAGED